MLRIGLTGGIASGKSTVCRLFAERGVTIIDADRIAREVVAPGTPGLAAVATAFGEAVLTPAGELDREAMRNRVFSDPEARLRLESIVHPLVRAEMGNQSLAATGAYCIVDVPLLVETGDTGSFHRILVVDVPVGVQRYRLRQRDGSSDVQIDNLLAAQASRAQRLDVADDVVDNSGPVERLPPQVERLHRSYLELACRLDSEETA